MRLILILSPLLLLAACAAREAATAPSTIKMKIGSRTYSLEIASTDLTRARGLMRRDSMPADHGMLFVFSDEEERSFWMKNVRFNLDIIFINAAGRVVSVKQMKAHDERPVPSDGPARYAIELNEGQAAAAGVKPGDSLTIPTNLQTAPE